jgi:hypothetical protein
LTLAVFVAAPHLAYAEPTDAPDLSTLESNNAWDYYLAAMDALPWDRPWRDLPPDASGEEYARAVAPAAHALALVHEGVGKPCHPGWASHAAENPSLLEPAAGCRQLALLIGAGIRAHHRQGDRNAALATAADGLAFSVGIARDAPQTARSIARACQAIVTHHACLVVQDTDDPDALTTLLQSALQARAGLPSLAEDIAFDREYVIEEFNADVAEYPEEMAEYYEKRYDFEFDATKIEEYTRRMDLVFARAIHIAATSNLPQTYRRFERLCQRDWIHDYALVVDVLAMKQVAETRAKLDLAAVGAALRIHLARTGEYPETLEELAPAILPTVPLDPCTDQPYLYERNAPDECRVWSPGWYADRRRTRGELRDLAFPIVFETLAAAMPTEER